MGGGRVAARALTPTHSTFSRLDLYCTLSLNTSSLSTKQQGLVSVSKLRYYMDSFASISHGVNGI